MSVLPINSHHVIVYGLLGLKGRRHFCVLIILPRRINKSTEVWSKRRRPCGLGGNSACPLAVRHPPFLHSSVEYFYQPSRLPLGVASPWNCLRTLGTERTKTLLCLFNRIVPGRIVLIVLEVRRVKSIRVGCWKRIDVRSRLHQEPTVTVRKAR